MVEQSRNKKQAKILLVYGYHLDETFHQKVVKDLQVKNLPNVRFVFYDGKRMPREKALTSYHFNDFVAKHQPVDYVIQLHDSPKAKDTKWIKMPYFDYWYESRLPRPKELVKELDWYEDYLKKFNGGRWINNRYIFCPNDDSPKNYGLFYVELFPHYATRNEAVMQMEGLISILEKYPLPKTLPKIRQRKKWLDQY